MKTLQKIAKKYRTTAKGGRPTHGRLMKVKEDITALLKEIETKVEEFSQLRFKLSDLSKAGDEEAEALYVGWTRVVHNYLAEGIENVGNETATWHGDEH